MLGKRRGSCARGRPLILDSRTRKRRAFRKPGGAAFVYYCRELGKVCKSSGADGVHACSGLSLAAPGAYANLVRECVVEEEHLT